ncbi:hypothetical protein WJX72_008302 [[Myrmecia] bisecta]|uniref:Large ribosomal subunit protein uL18c n=1 Tax=[Myrmecia] bisecta TaxID=41462 RepID=A0AAW1PN74_9CHLO
MQTSKLQTFTGLTCRGLPASRTQSSAPQTSGRLEAFRVDAAAITNRERTQRRRLSIRHKVEGRPERPRLAVYRSNNHIYAQVIDDSEGNTLAAASTLTPEIRQKLNGGGGANQSAAELVGAKIAELCLAKSIDKVCFDRGGHLYHGRIKALADAARQGGLAF